MRMLETSERYVQGTRTAIRAAARGRKRPLSNRVLVA